MRGDEKTVILIADILANISINMKKFGFIIMDWGRLRCWDILWILVIIVISYG